MRGRHLSRTWRPDQNINAPPRYRRPCKYDTFIPRPLTGLPALDPDVARTVVAAEEAIRELNAVAQPGLQALARLLLRSESIASSKVEGMQADARSLARAEAKFDLGISISSQQAAVLANVDAMQLAMEDAATAPMITIDHILAIQRALLARAVNADRIAGVVRSEQNWIGGNDYNPCGADFVPPPAKEIAHLLDDLVTFCNDTVHSPLVQAAYAHAQFETIHPFVDGNGRTGRALVQVILRRRGLAPEYVPPISVVLAANTQRYIDGLVAFREGDENEWIRVFAEAAARAAELASTYLARVQELQELWRERLDTLGVRSDAAAWRIIDVLPGHAIISVPVAVEATGRARAAVQQAVEQLVQAGVLEPLSAGRRNRQWEAIGLLALSEDFETLQVARAPSDLELMLRAKYAQAVLSAYRDIVNLGRGLLDELGAGIERGRGPADLRQRAEQWLSRSIAWADDPNGPLSQEERAAFVQLPPVPIPGYVELADAIANNLHALDAVRGKVEPDISWNTAEPTFRVTALSERVADDPHPRHRIYLRVENDGPAAPFFAQVVQIANSVTEPSVPWTIRWRESDARELSIPSGAAELLDVVESVPMGRDPLGSEMQPGLLIAHTMGGERDLRIAASSFDDLYVNEVGLAIEVTNTATSERLPVYLRIGMEKTSNLAPRLDLYQQRQPAARPSPVAVRRGRTPAPLTVSATAQATRERIDQTSVELDADFQRSQRERRDLIRGGYTLLPRLENPAEDAQVLREARAWAYGVIAWVKADRPGSSGEVPTVAELRESDLPEMEQWLQKLLALLERG